MSIFIVILGYEIYQKREILYDNKKLFLCGIVIYLTAHVLLTFFQLVLYKRDYTIGHVFSWDSTFAILGAVGLTISVFSIEFKSGRLEKIVCYIEKNTFYIYLIHFLVIKKLDSLGFGKWLLFKSGNAAVGEVVYTLCYIIVVFGISLIISSMIEMVKFIIRNRKSKKLEVE